MVLMAMLESQAAITQCGQDQIPANQASCCSPGMSPDIRILFFG
jgi:hypothetical protein